MNNLILYDQFLKADFLNRPNRFTMELEIRDKRISAYVPNTGRMEEFLTVHNPFFVVPFDSPKFDYKVIATIYQDNYVYLDTVRINSVFHYYLTRGLVPGFETFSFIRKEVKTGNSRLDFKFEDEEGNKGFIELKSCTLCHNGLAMFPDAPTSRGRKHLDLLHELADQGLSCYQIYLITNPSARYFIPNYHTDPEYARLLLKYDNISFRAYKLDYENPVTLKAKPLQEVPVDWQLTRKNNGDKGFYLIVMENPGERDIRIGALGNRRFRAGFYVYTGSALNSLENRISRHRRKRKKKRWHLDYICPDPLRIRKVYEIRGIDNIEAEIARRLLGIAEGNVPGFGSSDSDAESHLTYFRKDPTYLADFQKLLLDLRTSG